ncbi:hypothetical protein ACP70R_008587 [Stipagrostis hirtigluma subsp. patula]
MALLGQAANIAQVLGVDIFGLISMIVKGAQRVRRNEEACRLLSVRASMIKDRLQLLQASKFFERPETWKPAQGLKRTLLRAHSLILACRHSSYVYNFCMGCELADRLESVQKEMDAYNQYLSDIVLGILCNAFTVVIPLDFHGDMNIVNQDVAQVPAAGPSASHSNDNDRGNLTGDSGQCQPVTEGCIVTEGHLPENQRSSWCCWCPNISLRGRGLTKFSFSQLAHATNYFSIENEIGCGGCSTVYKGQLNTGLEVAVKRASYEGKTPVNHFQTEIKLIPKLRHRNIVKLLGYCIQKREIILVFEYMPNRSLDYFIYGVRAREAPLDWPKHRQIVEGIAQGAMYLHKLCEPRIIHGDLKPGNILLDNDFNPKICDFGISRALNPGAVEDCTGIITGSRGFIAPEYIGRGCLSVKADVYSFGVTLLQVISGIRFAPPPLTLSPESRDYGPLNKWAWDLWVAERLTEFIDPSLHTEPRKAEIMRWVQVALLCVQYDPEERPSMWDVLLMLSNENSILRKPNLPAYY